VQNIKGARLDGVDGFTCPCTLSAKHFHFSSKQQAVGVSYIILSLSVNNHVLAITNSPHKIIVLNFSSPFIATARI
jgi:hypothetical protein